MSRKVVTSAVVIVPPQSVWEPIQQIRKQYDKAYDRWMPHINLLYPFVPQHEFDHAERQFAAALSNFSSFTITVTKFGHFTFGKKSTLFLEPTEPEVKTLQDILFTTFPHCTDLNEKSEDGFHPHLTLGQFGSREINSIYKKFSHILPITWEVNEIHLISRPTDGSGPFSIKHSVKLRSAKKEPEPVFVDEVEEQPEEDNEEDNESEQWEEEDANAVNADWSDSPAIEETKQPSQEDDWLNGLSVNDDVEEWRPIEEEYRVVNTDNDWTMYLSYSPDAESSKYGFTEDTKPEKSYDAYDLLTEDEINDLPTNQDEPHEKPPKAKTKWSQPLRSLPLALSDECREMINEMSRKSDRRPPRRPKVIEPPSAGRLCNVCNVVVFRFDPAAARRDKFFKLKEAIAIYRHKFDVHNQEQAMSKLVEIALAVGQVQKRRRQTKDFELVLDWIRKTPQGNWPHYERFNTQLFNKMRSDTKKNRPLRQKFGLLNKRKENAAKQELRSGVTV